MSLERNASIESTTPEDESNTKASSTTTSNQANTSNLISKAPSAPQSKSKGKRGRSPSASPTSSKRPATSSTKPKPSQKTYAYTDLNNASTTPPPKNANPDSDTKSLTLTYHTGDLFAAPPRTLLIHACNTQGHWGAGIAKAFKTKYPQAYKLHHAFCAKQHSKDQPVPTGSAQLIAPVDADGDQGHWIGCLFTSAKYGKKKDKPDVIVRNTEEAMGMLLDLVEKADGEGEKGLSTIRMCKVNSGKFGVEWERTEEVLRGIVLREGWRGTVEVWEPEG